MNEAKIRQLSSQGHVAPSLRPAATRLKRTEDSSLSLFAQVNGVRYLRKSSSLPRDGQEREKEAAVNVGTGKVEETLRCRRDAEGGLAWHRSFVLLLHDHTAGVDVRYI